MATGIEEHDNYAVGVHRGHAPDQAPAARLQGERRREQHLVLVPRQQGGAGGDALGLPVPRHQRRDGHGHRQRRASSRSTRRSPPTCASWSRTCSSTAGPTPPSGWWPSPRPVKQAEQRRGGGGSLAAGHGRGAALPRPGEGDRGPRRGGRRGGAAEVRAAARGDRGPAHGRHERGRATCSARAGCSCPRW